MIHPLRAWNRFFFRPTSGRSLGIIRIGFGLIALANLGFCAVDLEHWYTDAGLIQGDAIRAVAGRFQHSPLHYIQDPASVRVAFGFTAVAAAFLTIGLRTRLMGILFYLGMLSLQLRNTSSSSGADVLLMTFAFNLMLSPCGASYSVDAWLERRRRGGTAAEALILPWTLRLIQIQICLVYVVAGVLKASGTYWQNGTALHYVFTNTEVRRLDLSFLTQYPTLINLMTYGAVVSEFFLAFFLWFRSWRPFVIWVGIALHAGILISINIPCFGELMWIGYLAFLTPPEFDHLARCLDVRRLFGRAPAGIPEPTPAAPAFPGTSTVRIDGPSEPRGPHVGLPEPDFDPEPALVGPGVAGRGWSAKTDEEIFGPYQVIL